MKENWKIFVENHTLEDTTVFLRGMRGYWQMKFSVWTVINFNKWRKSCPVYIS